MKSHNWLDELFEKRRTENWCDYFCTKCGFGRYLVFLLFRELKLPYPVNSSNTAHFLLPSVPDEYRPVIDMEIIRVLRNYTPCHRSPKDIVAERTVLLDIDSYFSKFSDTASFAKLLNGTYMGELLKAMIVHSKRLEVEHRIREEESRIREENKKNNTALKKVLKEEAVRLRRDNKQKRDLARQNFVGDFQNLNEYERLNLIADEKLGFPLKAIPVELISTNRNVIASLSNEQKGRLLKKINKCAGFWGKYKRLLS